MGSHWNAQGTTPPAREDERSGWDLKCHTLRGKDTQTHPRSDRDTHRDTQTHTVTHATDTHTVTHRHTQGHRHTRRSQR